MILNCNFIDSMQIRLLLQLTLQWNEKYYKKIVIYKKENYLYKDGTTF